MAMPKFNFKENSEAIFDMAVAETPFPFRKVTKNGLIELLLEEYGEDGAITEAGIVDIIKKNTPKPFLARGMKVIKPLLADPSLAEI